MKIVLNITAISRPLWYLLKVIPVPLSYNTRRIPYSRWFGLYCSFLTRECWLNGLRVSLMIRVLLLDIFGSIICVSISGDLLILVRPGFSWLGFIVCGAVPDFWLLRISVICDSNSSLFSCGERAYLSTYICYGFFKLMLLCLFSISIVIYSVL